jgi:hypothetical protein
MFCKDLRVTQILIELYDPTPVWLALSSQDRQALFAEIGAGMGDLLALGIEPLAFGEVDTAAAHSAPQRFFAVWRAPDRESLDALMAGIAASGWHSYFATVNAAGAISDLAAHLGQLDA